MARKFKFISPGIFLREIDKSELAQDGTDVGPVVIGRTRKGPSLVPVKVNSYADFVELFGTPVPGPQAAGDVWRSTEAGTAPTYAAYAAQAWLANNSPCTVVRLAGAAHEGAGASPDGPAGWKVGAITNTASTNAGAFGLFVWASGSDTEQRVIPNEGAGWASQVSATGTLAAVWYLTEGAITLSGNLAGKTYTGAPLTSSAATLIRAADSTVPGGEWTVELWPAAGTTASEKLNFSFNRTSGSFVRSVFNTSPPKTNSTITDTTKTYWLGETFETNVLRTIPTGQTYVGAILGLEANIAGTKVAGGDFEKSVAQGETGWFVSQDLNTSVATFNPADLQKLFKIKSLPVGGLWEQGNVKISIQDIDYSIDVDVAPYGTFTLVVRTVADSDENVSILESYTGLTLNPNSADYIARRIGDMDMTWDGVKRQYTELGNYPNVSNYITVEVHSDVENGNVDPEALPFGFFGPPRYRSMTLGLNATGSAFDPRLSSFAVGGNRVPYWPINSNVEPVMAFLSGSHSVDHSSSVNAVPKGAPTGFPELLLPLAFPSLEDWLRVKATDGTGEGPVELENSYFGLQTNGGVAGPAKTTQFSPSYIDMVRMKPKSVNSFTAASGSRTEVSFIFTLDNVVGTFDSNAKLTEATYTSGSRKAGTSITAVSASAGNYKEVLDKNINRFTAPMFGGTDGVDITEMDPFNNASMGSSETTAYEYNSVRRAIDSVSDAERVPMNVLAMPGIDTPTLTKHMINVAEGRGDALAVIDLAGGFTPRAESKDSLATRVGNVTTVIDNVKSRKLNSSYGCAYYPWVQILDTDASAVLHVPPSVAALGTFASSEKTSALWFAPAGFNRGGLTQGSAGLSVLNTDGQLTSKDRDKLYSVNVNPIAKFPAEGVVIFGQKTLQIKASALDRINVRRLLIYVKREISQIAAGVLFEQNIAATWNEFAAKADLFLEGVKIGGGLADYKVVLDDTTTTPDLVDRNIMYAKVFLKPARAIEFIAVDFIITRSGASFDD